MTIFVQERKTPIKLVEKSQPAKTVNLAVNDETKESSASNSVNKTVVANQKSESANDSRFVYHTVAPGDTLWKIAQRYEGMTVEQIKEINKLRTNDLKIGARIKVLIQG